MVLGMNRPIAITASGMVSGVGLDSLSTSAAIRGSIDNFQETNFLDQGGEYIQGCAVPLSQPWQGITKLAEMLAMSLTECATSAKLDIANTPVLICIAEQDRPGRDNSLAQDLLVATEERLSITLHPDSKFIEYGRVGGLVALSQARDMVYGKNFNQVIIAGVDSLLTGTAISVYERQNRLLTSLNSNGFIPGEGAGSILIERPQTQRRQLICRGIGFAVEQATIESDEPLRANGLTQAVKIAFEEANSSMGEMDFRIVDVAGEHYWFKETALVLGRLLRVHKEGFPLWHVADSVGEIGAAILMVSIGHARNAYLKGFDDGPNMLTHISNNDGKRGAAVFWHGVTGQ